MPKKHSKMAQTWKSKRAKIECIGFFSSLLLPSFNCNLFSLLYLFPICHILPFSALATLEDSLKLLLVLIYIYFSFLSHSLNMNLKEIKERRLNTFDC